MSEQAIAQVRRHYEAYNAGNLEALIDGFHPEIELVAGDAAAAEQFGPEHRGRPAVREFFADLFDNLAESRVEVIELKSDGERVVASVQMHGRFRDTGVAASLPAVHAFSFRDDLIVRQEYFSPPQESSPAAPG